MRARRFSILGHYSIAEFTQILTSSNAAYKLEAVANFMGIDLARFSRIHTRELKIEQLHYRFLLKEFEAIQEELTGKISEIECELICELADQSQKIIELSQDKENLVTNHRSAYSELSQGLMGLDRRSTFQTSFQDQLQNTQSLRATIIPIKPKESGIERGFEAIQKEDILKLLGRKFPDAKARKEFIIKHHADLAAIYTEVKSELVRYIVKLTDEVGDDNKIVPRAQDINRTNTVKNIKKKSEILGNAVVYLYQRYNTCTPTQKNLDAMIENLTNDIARLFMLVQAQELYPGESDKGIFQLLLKAEWVENASTVKTVGWNKLSTHNVRAQPLFFPQKDLEFISDSSLKKLSELLIFNLVKSDRDTVGSDGQNGLCRDGEVIGIDFGHAYPAHQVVFTPDFHVVDKEFKNFSIYYDAPRSTIAKGLFKLARLAGHALDETVLKSYGEDFYTEIMAIVPHSDEIIFDDYCRKFAAMQNDFDNVTAVGRQNRQCCVEIIAHIEVIRKRHLLARQKVLEVGAVYLTLPRHITDLLENIEKGIAAGIGNTSLRSVDGHVLLNHIRITKGEPPIWSFQAHEQDHQMTMHFSSSASAQKAVEGLRIWLQQFATPPLKPKSVAQVRNSIILNFDAATLQLLAKSYSEDQLKMKYHREDYFHHCTEIELQKLTAIFAECSLPVKFSKQSNPPCIQLDLIPESHALSQIFIKRLVTDFNFNHSANRFHLNIQESELQKVTEKLALLPALFKKDKQTEINIVKYLIEYDQLQKILCDILNLPANQLFTLERAQEVFLFKYCTEKFDDILSQLISKRPKFDCVSPDSIPDLCLYLTSLTDEYLTKRSESKEMVDEFELLVLSLQVNFRELMPKICLNQNAAGRYILAIEPVVGEKKLWEIINKLIAEDFSPESNNLTLRFDQIALLNKTILKAANHFLAYRNAENEKLAAKLAQEKIANEQLQAQKNSARLQASREACAQFESIKERYIAHPLMVGLALGLDIDLDENRFCVSLNATNCDSSLQVLLAAKFGKSTQTPLQFIFSGPDAMQQFNKGLNTVCNDFLINCIEVTSRIRQDRLSLLESLSDLIISLNREPHANSSILASSLQTAKNTYSLFFNSEVTAVNLTAYLHTYTSSSERYAADTLCELGRKLARRKEHIHLRFVHSLEQYTQELQLLEKCIGVCNALQLYTACQLKYVDYHFENINQAVRIS